MGSSIDSSRPTALRRSQRQRRNYGPNLYGLEVFGNAFTFAEPAGGCSWKDSECVWPALPLEHGDLRDIIAIPQHPGPGAIQAQPVDAVDALYAPHFRRLELELEASRAGSALHVPPLVSGGRVAQVSLEVDSAGAAEPVLSSVLEEHVPGNQAK